MSRPVTPLKIAVARSGRHQREIAEAAGISPSQFSRIVNGLHTDEHTQERLALVLGQTVEQLWPGRSA